VHWMLYRVNYESELGCQFSAEFLANHLPKFSASWVYCTVLMSSPSQFFFHCTIFWLVLIFHHAQQVASE
jgi:uncharacterized membrane protein